MKINTTPIYDQSHNPQDCCPQFQSKGWNNQDLYFRDKLFVRAETKSKNYVPVDMAQIFGDTYEAIFDEGAGANAQTIVLSRNLSPDRAEHLFAVTKNVSGQEMVKLSGNYKTKVFEGSFENQPIWDNALQHLAGKPKGDAATYYFFTTCPDCADAYGENYVVGLVEANGAPPP